MRRFTKISIIALFVLLLMTGAFAAGAFVGAPSLMAQSGRNADLVASELPEEFAVFWQAWNIVQDRFVDQDVLDETELTYGAIEGMLGALGDQGHTTFLTPKELEYQRSDISGKFFGIGARIGVRDMLPMIVAPFDGSPADKAGVAAGDIILAVDGNDTADQSLGDIVDQIRGPEGTDVTLTMLRIDDENTTSLDITITRGEIEVPAASWGMIPGTDVGLLRLSQFSANATDNLVAAIEEAEAEGAEAFVLDLRNNPGGLLQQAIRVTSQFLADGNVLQEEDAQGRRRAYSVRRGGVATEIPLVVLINAGSASSAEILAGALQDYERATLIGDTTFGTGTVLEPFMLDDGSALMLGTKQWLTAEGRLIRKQGITPDIELALPIGTDLISTDELDELEVADLLASEDAQLLKALEVLDALPEAELEVEAEVDNELEAAKVDSD